MDVDPARADKESITVEVMKHKPGGMFSSSKTKPGYLIAKLEVPLASVMRAQHVEPREEFPKAMAKRYAAKSAATGGAMGELFLSVGCAPPPM